MRIFLAALALLGLTSCSFSSPHKFAEPGKHWQTRSGQLQYKNVGRTVVGDVVIRYSKHGDFELTFSKGPGIPMLTIQQNEQFAHVTGPLARLGWTGRVDHAPQQLRGWLSLRDVLIHAQDRHVISHQTGAETFQFRF
ncbi:MAG: hypothetical protein QOG48_256 [Verrucomicrobiota bacterium]|jgi:hypothetical protein